MTIMVRRQGLKVPGRKEERGLRLIAAPHTDILDNSTHFLPPPRAARSPGPCEPAGRVPDPGDSPFIKRLMRVLKVTRHDNVLFAGCAGNPVIVPLARKAKQVIVMDDSPETRGTEKRRCRKKTVENIAFHGAEGAAMPDVVVWSLPGAPSGPDKGIVELSRRARRGVYLLVGVGEGPLNRRIVEAAGRELVMGPSFINCYNHLYYGMGIYANVTFLREEMENEWPGPEEAFLGETWMLGDLTMAEEERVRAYLARTLVPVDGHVRLPYERSCRWALIWWEKESPPKPGKNVVHSRGMGAP